MSSYHISEVQSKKELQQFIKYPSRLYSGNKRWMPSIYLDEFDYFNPRKNPQIEKNPIVLFLCKTTNGDICGRIMGILPKEYNTLNNTKDLRFTLLEYDEDIAIAESLIEAVLQWAKDHKLDTLVGPLGFSDKDPQGYMIEGFEHTPVIATHVNSPKRIEDLKNLGFEKKLDLFVFRIDIPENNPALHDKIAERSIRNNPGIELLNLRYYWQLKQWIVPVFELVNKSFEDIYAFTPLTKKEMHALSWKYLPLLKPRFIKILKNKENQVIAFVLAMPNITEGLRKSKGYMLPFGIFQLWRAQRKTKQLDMMLGAVHPDYQNKGLDAQLAIALFDEARKAGFAFVDSHLELETNVKMHSENIKLGGYKYKTYRIFKRAISS